MPNFIALGCLEICEKLAVVGWVGSFQHQEPRQTNLSYVRLMLSWVVTIAPKREVSEIESENKIDKARKAQLIEIEIKFLVWSG